jgi:hypothetical protein
MLRDQNKSPKLRSGHFSKGERCNNKSNPLSQPFVKQSNKCLVCFFIGPSNFEVKNRFLRMRSVGREAADYIFSSVYVYSNCSRGRSFVRITFFRNLSDVLSKFVSKEIRRSFEFMPR